MVAIALHHLPNLRVGGRAPDTHGMEAIAPISNATSTGQRPAGWQQQIRVDYAVNKVMQTHRGHNEDQVAQAINDQLRAAGVVPNGRLIAQYAAAISALPELPPRNKS